MCQKVKWGSFRIDPCLRPFIEWLNTHHYKTILSCCGHERYKATILIHNQLTDDVIEYFSLKTLSHVVRPRKRYYKKDAAGYYYIPEVSEAIP